MKELFNSPISIYIVAVIACICVMIIVDFILGNEAEHLNAWVIINRIIGNETGIGDSLAIQHFGLFGATILMILTNTVFGIILIQIIKLIIRLVHS